MATLGLYYKPFYGYNCITLLQDDVFFTDTTTFVGATILSLMTFSISTLSMQGLFVTLRHSPLQQYVLSAIMLSVTIYLLLC